LLLLVIKNVNFNAIKDLIINKILLLSPFNVNVRNFSPLLKKKKERAFAHISTSETFFHN